MSQAANPKHTIHGEPAYRLSSDLVELFITARGGQIAPVRFTLPEGAFAQPYSLAPWLPDAHPEQPPILQILRGDFFCFPFGVTEGIPLPHGETANQKWTLVAESEEAIQMEMQLANPAGTVTKSVQLRPGHRVLYQEHVLTGITGRFNYGHHAILQFPEGVTCPVRTSAFKLGQVYPGVFAQESEGERTALKAGARFEHLDSVELADGGPTSLASYPARDGFEDLVMISAADSVTLGWTAVSFPGYVWISLRSTRQFPSTLFWMSNGGRPQAPWSGQHRRRMGVEDVCSHFHDGADESARDLLTQAGIPTAHDFQPEQSTTLRHAQLVVPTHGSPAVQAITPQTDQDQIEIRFEDGSKLTTPLDWRWLMEVPQ